MKRDRLFDIDTFNRLDGIARSIDDFHIFQTCDDVEATLDEYMSHYRTTCDDYHRPTAYEWFKRLLAYAFDEAHPSTVWKKFYVVWSGGRDYSGVAYTLDGEGMGEEQATREHIAHDHDTTPNMVTFDYVTASAI